MRSRKYLVVFFILIVVVLLVVFWMLHRTPKVERLYSKLTSNVQDAGLFDNELYYFTGSFFAKYNFNDRKIIQLSDWLDIKDGSSNINWNKNAVVFSTKPAPGTRDDITTAASQLGADPSSSHWWRYDFTTKQYQLLDFAGIDGCTSLIQINNDSLLCQKASGDGNTVNEVYLFDLGSRSSNKVFSTKDTIGRLSAYGKDFGFIVTTLGGKQRVYQGDLITKKPKQIYLAKGDVSYKLGGEGQALISNTKEKIKGEDSHKEEDKTSKAMVNYELYFVQNGTLVNLGKVKAPLLTLYRNNGLFASSINGSVYELKNDKLELIEGPSKETLDAGAFIFSVDGESLLLQNGVLSTEEVVELNTRSASEYNPKEDADLTGNSWIDNSVDPLAAYLYLPNVKSSDQQALVGKHLSSRGFVPAEFNLTWVVDGFDFHTPIKPNAISIR